MTFTELTLEEMIEQLRTHTRKYRIGEIVQFRMKAQFDNSDFTGDIRLDPRDGMPASPMNFYQQLVITPEIHRKAYGEET